MHCPRCKSESIVKAGLQSKKQRYKCKSCSRLFVENAHRGFSQEIKAKAIALYLEGLGFRAIGRLLGVSNVAVLKWVRKAAQTLPEPEPSAQIKLLEMDELCHYIKKRAQKSGCGLLLTAHKIKRWDSHWVAVVSGPSKNYGKK